MRYQIGGDDLCIRIPLDAIAENAGRCLEVAAVKDKAALALALGREVCEREDNGEEFFLSRVLDAGLVRVIESADASLDYQWDV